jgi:Rad3-related DNA helicase
MTKGAKTELNQSSRNYSKAQRAALEEAEAKILNKNADKKLKPTRKLDKAIQKIFNQYAKDNPALTVDDSQLLTELADYQYQYNELAVLINELDIFDDRREKLEKRQQNVSRLISQRLKELNIMRIARLAEAQAEAKLKIEQQKADSMSKDDEPVNPLLLALNKRKGAK